MSDRIKDLNSPSPWNMRIWDEAKHQWLCDGGDDALPYYGFDIRGGEVTAFQGIDWIYKQHRRWNNFIWERSTGLTDKNSKEIYVGDIVEIDKYGKFQIIWNEWVCKFDFDKIGKREREEPLLSQDWEQKTEVIGNIHENPQLLGGEDEQN